MMITSVSVLWVLLVLLAVHLHAWVLVLLPHRLLITISHLLRHLHHLRIHLHSLMVAHWSLVLHAILSSVHGWHLHLNAVLLLHHLLMSHWVESLVTTTSSVHHSSLLCHHKHLVRVLTWIHMLHVLHVSALHLWMHRHHGQVWVWHAVTGVSFSLLR